LLLKKQKIKKKPTRKKPTRKKTNAKKTNAKKNQREKKPTRKKTNAKKNLSALLYFPHQFLTSVRTKTQNTQKKCLVRLGNLGL